MKISIVIPTYNEEKYIGKTLRSVKQLNTNGWEIEIIIIDAGSSDKTAQIAKTFGAKIVTIPHRGIGFARQKGIEHASGAIVIYTDADTIVPPDWLERHVQALSSPGAVFSYGAYRVMDGNFPYYQFINYIFPQAQKFFHFILHKPAAVGQNLAFWREKALKVSGFDENILVMEDTDMAVRMTKIGKVVFTPNLIVYSSGRRSREGLIFFWRMAKESVKYFLLGNRKLGIFPDFR